MRPDLKLHTLAGVILATYLGLLIAPLWGFVLAAVFAVLKELLWDKALGKGTPAVDDAAYTVIAAAFAALFVYLAERLI
jgi:tetrahydromethanopterin S-methyltransferase subunit C